MCSRISAIGRLVALYIDRLLANPDYHLQVSIADVLTEENIGVVQDLNRWGGCNDARRHRRGHLPRRLDRRVACCDPRTFTSEA